MALGQCQFEVSCVPLAHVAAFTQGVVADC